MQQKNFNAYETRINHRKGKRREIEREKKYVDVYNSVEDWKEEKWRKSWSREDESRERGEKEEEER